MQTQSLSQTQKLEKLVKFFDTFKIKTFPAFVEGEKDGIHVIDERNEKWTAIYTISLEDNKIVIHDFVIVTPNIEMKYDGDLMMKIAEKDTGKEKMFITWYNVKPLKEDVNYFTLNMLITKPAYFIGYSALLHRDEIDQKFALDVAHELWDYRVDIGTEEVEIIDLTVNELKKGE